MYVSEVAILQFVAIRFCTTKTWFSTRIPPFRQYRPRAAVCRISTLLFIMRFVRFCSCYIVFSSQPTTKLHLKYGPKTTFFFSSSEAETRTKNVPPAGRLQRAHSGSTSEGAPLPAGGGGRGRGLATTTSALLGPNVLAYDATSKYCTG